MHKINKFWSMFGPQVQYRWEERDFLELKNSLKKSLLPVLLIAIIGILIPYTVQFFIKDLTPQKFIIIALFPIALGFLILQRKIEKYAGLFLTALLIAIIAILTTAYQDLLPHLNQNESFYTGYSFAMVIRLIGYNMVSLKYSLFIFLVQIPLKFSLVRTSDVLQIIIVLALDLATIGLRCKSEIVEIGIFDMLYKMEKSVRRFKSLLTQFIPNQIAIFANDYSTTYFVNNAFNRTFRVNRDLNLAKGALENLIIESETIERQKVVFKNLGFQNLEEEKNLTMSLNTFMNALSLNFDCLCDVCSISFSVIEKEPLDDSYTIDEDEGKKAFKLKIFPLLWDDKEAIGIVFINITSQRELMELKIADKNRDKTISMVSHELRTPLNGILGLLDIIRKSVKEPETLSYLKACQNSGVLMLNLVNSMLDMNQAKSRKLRLVYTKVSLAKLLHEIKSLFDIHFKAKNLDSKVEVDDNVPKMIITDRNRLNQILVNLLSNTLKFTLSGGVTLRVSLVCGKSNQVRFCVKDTGIGIRKEDQETLLRRLNQQDRQPYNQSIGPQGTGLGLKISNALAELLNLTENQGLCIESEVNVGTCISFIVESQNPEEASGISEDEEEVFEEDIGEERGPTLLRKINAYTNPCADNFGKMTNVIPDEDSTENENDKPWCLIVDDNPFNLMVACHIVQERGYQVKTALNGKEAVEKFKDHEAQRLTFRLTLMDCQMPVMDGYEATKTLKELMKSGELHECPIIALTYTKRSEEHDKLCQNVGMSGHIIKPLQIEDLGSLLTKIERIENKKKGYVIHEFFTK